MRVFETIKAAVPLRQAAEHYGLRVLPNGMTCCPFHEDRHPSMKLNEDYFFCFGCSASGDVIDFTARLFGISRRASASIWKRACTPLICSRSEIHHCPRKLSSYSLRKPIYCVSRVSKAKRSSRWRRSYQPPSISSKAIPYWR